VSYLQDRLEEFADHYARLALTNGWIDYVRHRVGQMQKDKMYKGLGDMVKNRMEELKNENYSGFPTSRFVPEPIQGQALGGNAQVQDNVQRVQLLDNKTANAGVETQRGRPVPHPDLFDDGQAP
jgi:hypothetical protein